MVDGERRWLVVAILGADRVLGAMVADDEDAVPDDVARPTLERAAQVAALVSFKRDAVSAIRAERRARVLGAVLDGSAEASVLSTEVVHPLVGAAAIDVRGREGALTVAADAIGDHGLVTVREHGLVVAWTASVGAGAGAGAGGAGLVAATERVRRILAEKLDDPSVTAVVGATVDGVPALRASVERAVRDLRFLGPLGVSGATVRSDDFAPYHVLSSGSRRLRPGSSTGCSGRCARGTNGGARRSSTPSSRTSTRGEPPGCRDRAARAHEHGAAAARPDLEAARRRPRGCRVPVPPAGRRAIPRPPRELLGG